MPFELKMTSEQAIEKLKNLYGTEITTADIKAFCAMNDITYQTVDGFGAGIKRRTEHLYALNEVLRNQIESYAFQELEANMIRFFVYHDLEDPNDNNNPFNLCLIP